MLVWGHALILRWVGAEMADNSAPLLPIFLLAYALVLAAQFNSSSLLFGVGHHGKYARGLIVEAVCYVALLWWVVPRYGDRKSTRLNSSHIPLSRMPSS